MFNKIKKHLKKNQIPMTPQESYEKESFELGKEISETIKKFNETVKDKGYEYALEVKHQIALQRRPLMPQMPDKLTRDKELNDKKNGGKKTKNN